MIQELQSRKAAPGARPNPSPGLPVAQVAPKFLEELGRIRARQAEQFEQGLFEQAGTGGPLAEAGEFHNIAPDRPRTPGELQGVGLKGQPRGQVILWTAIASAIVFGGIALFILLAALSRQ
jgi:hypothetical protein